MTLVQESYRREMERLDRVENVEVMAMPATCRHMAREEIARRRCDVKKAYRSILSQIKQAVPKDVDDETTAYTVTSLIQHFASVLPWSDSVLLTSHVCPPCCEVQPGLSTNVYVPSSLSAFSSLSRMKMEVVEEKRRLQVIAANASLQSLSSSSSPNVSFSDPEDDFVMQRQLTEVW